MLINTWLCVVVGDAAAREDAVDIVQNVSRSVRER